MKRALLITSLFFLTPVLYAGLTFPLDDAAIEPISISSYSGFSGDVSPETSVSLIDIHAPANAINWSDFDPEAYEFISIYMPGDLFLRRIPSELAGIVVQLVGVEPLFISPELVSVMLPEPVGCVLMAGGFLLLRRRH